jgi:hypothetical protein
MMGDPLAPAPQVARRGHRAPGARGRLKAGAPSRRLAVEADFVGIPQGRTIIGGVGRDFDVDPDFDSDLDEDPNEGKPSVGGEP